MINITWGFVGIVALVMILNMYRTVGFTNPAGVDWGMRITSIVFFLGSAALFFLWVKGGKVKQRFLNYSIFTIVISAAALFLSFFRPIRMFLSENGILTFFHTHAPDRFIYSFMILVGAWLLGGFVWFIIKSRKI